MASNATRDCGWAPASRTQRSADPVGRSGAYPTNGLKPVRRIAARLAACVDRHRQRKRLAELSDHLLADIGYTRREAAVEARKRFWQP